jgi:hypothetical protein
MLSFVMSCTSLGLDKLGKARIWFNLKYNLQHLQELSQNVPNREYVNCIAPYFVHNTVRMRSIFQGKQQTKQDGMFQIRNYDDSHSPDPRFAHYTLNHNDDDGDSDGDADDWFPLPPNPLNELWHLSLSDLTRLLQFPDPA